MKAIIFTEGQTDWKHFKKAYEKLNINLDIEFWDDTNDRGDNKMLAMCETRAKAPNDYINIFVFDRDNPDINAKTNTAGNNFKTWGNNVFSFSIPIPTNRSVKSNSLSIEFYYSDDILYSQDMNGKRLFSSTEFDEKSSRHKTIQNISYGNNNKLKGITSEETSKIIDSEVFNEKHESIALSKNKFTEYIQNETIPYKDVDFGNFKLIFDVIKKIIDSVLKTSYSIIPIEIVKKNRFDHPPVIDIFVGRSDLIAKLIDPNIRVAAITGLGGEGKSSLAAKIYKIFSDTGPLKRFNQISWVDCKDEETTFHEKLLGVLENLTESKHTKSMYAEENVKDTINRFLDVLNNNNCFVVFDNVDAFVDKDSPSFTGHVKSLFDALTSKLSSSYVLFTCRSSISDPHFSFVEIPIQGFSLEETLELAENFNLTICNEHQNIIQNIHDKTKGHALWLNLIFGHLRNNRLSLDQINSIISKQTLILNVHLLDSIWDNLDKNEKEIISILCTLTRPPTLNKIEKASSLSYQKCVKVINTLLKLRLIISLDKEGDIHYDLHPIIRIKAKETLASPTKKFFVIKIIKSLADWNKLVSIMNLYDDFMPQIEDYIECAEIAIENNQYKEALKYLYKLSDPLLKYGHDVKYVELCESTFRNLIINDEEVKISEEFTTAYSHYIETLLNQDEFKKVDTLLDVLANSLLSIKDYIFYSERMTYNLWFQNRFSEAIDFAKTSIKKITDKGEVVPSNIYYDLALGNRDNGNVTEALNYFIEKTSLEKIESWDPAAKGTDDISADVGNISRCYFLLGNYDFSLKYCFKSNKYLENGKNRHSKVNYGYSLLWLAESYFKLGDKDNTKLNVEKAITVWTKYCPSRLKNIKKHMDSYPQELKKSLNDSILNSISTV